ncbi:hypothetical protein CHS0354_038481 [Potamilus streckersoni]|uniref:Uncharacterized protein n=1 Tax=Potamilus streckersoni TaxID=2493646 RepID=A0AAE0S677_9BIVA|nr:hypothetical protein CHS0354_038481 [Potamilus streckersoni]
MTATRTTNGTQMPMTHQSPGMYAPSYPTFPQMAGSYSPGNVAMNYSYPAPPSMNNPYDAPETVYDNAVSH